MALQRHNSEIARDFRGKVGDRARLARSERGHVVTAGGSRFAKQEGIYRNETKRNEISRNLRNEIETQLCAFVHCQIYSDSDWGTLSLLSLSLFEHTALGLHRKKKDIVGGHVFYK